MQFAELPYSFALGFGGYSLDIWDGGWLLGSSLGPFFEHELGGAFWFLVGGEFGDWSQRAVGWVLGDFFDGGLGFGFGVGFGEVLAGDLEAVEQEAGSFGVEIVGGQALEDFADGVLDGGAVFGEWDLEGRAAGFAAG